MPPRIIDFIHSRARRREEFLRTLSPVVLMGRGHSGTRIFATYCSLIGVEIGERPGRTSGDPADTRFTNLLKRIAIDTLHITSTQNVPPRHARRFQASVERFYRSLDVPPGNPWGWKFPETYLIAPLVLHAFPHARFIHMLRDGRDLAFKRHLTDDVKRPLGRALLSHLNAQDLPHHLQAAVSWEHQVRRFRTFAETIAPGRLLEVRFEEMCANPFHVGEQISDFLELPTTSEARDYLQSSIDRDKIAQYRGESSEDIAEVEERIGPMLSKLGYI